MPPKTVYYVGTCPRTLMEDVARIVDMSVGPHLDGTRPTLVKINGNYDRYYPGSNSSPWMIDALLKTLRDRGFTRLTVVEGDLPQFRARDMIVRTKLKPILDKYGVPFVAYEQQARDRHEIPLIFRDSQLINNPVPHGHGIAKMSCACKNLFGILPVTRRRYHGALSDKLIELVARLPMYTVVDGTVGLEGESTRRGNPRRLDVLLAGYDPYAIDAVVARILGFAPEEIPLLAEAQRRGLARYEVDLRGDTTDMNALPVHPFAHHVSLLRRSSMKLETTRLEQNRVFVWLLHKVVRANHGMTFHRKKKMLYRGSWMQYAESIGLGG